ncbi:hypothetical protein [Fusobacterium perfoetens]|uniref:hypothetical protein n=1 Tax=Fusobacterium perfoetens TaxID=852 RepID=UPI001F23C872|nr:hypothetical protein [Fusobacterium perfoetens]MCF2611597.1 hypothetical protein [Fusobacterium perfoetens]
MWRCKDCGVEIKSKIETKAISILTLDKNRKIIDQKTKIVNKELLHHFCKKCGNKSYFLEDIAEWVEGEQCK